MEENPTRSDIVTLKMSTYDYSRLVTSIKRYSEVLYSASAYYSRQTGRDPKAARNRSSCTTIFHLLTIPQPQGETSINLCEYPPIPPPCYTPKRTRKKKEVNNVRSILKDASKAIPKKNVSFSE